MATLLLDETKVIAIGVWMMGLVALAALAGLLALIFNPWWFVGRLLGLVAALALGVTGTAWSDERHTAWPKWLLFLPFIASIFTVLFFPRKSPN